MSVAFVQPGLLYAWNGHSLLVVNSRGDCGDDHPLSGFYHHETRVLRSWALEINGERPWLCEAALLDPQSLAFTYAYPEIKEPGGGGTGQAGDEEPVDDRGLPVRSLDIRVRQVVRLHRLDVRVEIANRARTRLTIELGWRMGADFADIQEAQAGRRFQEADVQCTARPGLVEFSYAHRDLPMRCEIRHPAPWRRDGTRLVSQVGLDPQERCAWDFEVAAFTGVEDLDDAAAEEREAARESWRRAFACVAIPRNRAAEAVISSNLEDFASFPLLGGPSDEWLTPGAGMPLYPAFFGRDAVTAGWQAAYVDRARTLDAALTRLGRLQSARFEDWTDEQPGRIPYQVRTGPLARLNVNPFAAYYADFASPLMYVISLANLYAWTGDVADVKRHWDTARRICDWARQFGDADGDGYLEYRTRSPKGAKNQGWKDSGDAIVYDDGSPVPAPIATCEIQGYWYIAQELMAFLSVALDAPHEARAHRESASALKERFNRDWWMEDEGCYALALDPDKRQVRAVTSNLGHCLACGIVNADRLPRLVERLFAPDLFSGWGIRTLSARHAFYNPLSYHRGSVWAVECATTVFGLRRYGFDREALRLMRALFDLAELYGGYRIPECVGGYAREEAPTPGAYPRSNTPQLWNATAFPLMVQTMLGLLPIAPINTLILDPVLPPWIPDLVLHDLRVGQATATLRFWRDGDRSDWEVVSKTGTLHIVRQPPPESLTATGVDRLRGLLESIWR
jgi:glycogen debranching enzyme